MSVTRGRRDERGAALLLAIILSTILGLLASVVALTARAETLIAGRVAHGQVLRYAADGALELAIADLSGSDWNAALGGGVSSFTVGDPRQLLAIPGIAPLHLCCGAGSLTPVIEHAANGAKSWGGDTPQWHLYAWGPADSWLQPGQIRAAIYVAVWIADDASDGDGNPAADANGTIGLYAAALGPGDGRRAVRALLARPVDPLGKPRLRGVRIVAWHETQW